MPAPPQLETGVYVIRNKANGKVYVGSAAVSFRKRWANHLCDLRRGRHGYPNVSHLQRAWDRYGEDAFEFSVVERVPPDRCLEREQVWLDFYRATDPKCGYNACPEAGNRRGTKWSAGQRDKAMAVFTSPEYRAACAARVAGSKQSPETLAKRSAATKGRPLAPEHRAKIVAANEARRGKAPSAEARARMSASRLAHASRTCARIEWQGRTETLAEWSRVTGIAYKTLSYRLASGWPVDLALTAAPGSSLAMERMAQGKRGIAQTPEANAKRSKAMKAAWETGKMTRRHPHALIEAAHRRRGKPNYAAYVLTRAQVEEIRQRYVPRCPVNGASALGREMGVSKRAILNALHGRTWREA